MTEKPTEHRTPASQKTWLWMSVALVAVTGFMFWLAAASGTTEVVVEEQPEAADVSGAQTMTLDQVTAQVDSLVGRTIRLERVEVTALVAPRVFWTSEAVSGRLLLVRLVPGATGQAPAVQAGDAVTVSGRVVAMTDSVVDAWELEGVIAAERREEAKFATAFLEALQARPAAGAAGEQGAQDAPADAPADADGSE